MIKNVKKYKLRVCAIGVCLVLLYALNACAYRSYTLESTTQTETSIAAETTGDAGDAAVAVSTVATTVAVTATATSQNGDSPQETTSVDVSSADDSPVCTLYVLCDVLLSNMDKLAPDKIPLVPEDGIIYFSDEVGLEDGDSVFDILLRELRREKIHFEFTNTPALNSVYIEGINNLYEFDCGELSGWTYKVNGKVPGYGCAQYTLKPGDVVEIAYTCDLGADIGSEFQ